MNTGDKYRYTAVPHHC